MNRRKPHTEETKRKIAAALTGRKHSASTIAAIREARLGTHHDDETRTKISAALQGNGNGSRRAVIQLTTDGNAIIAQYASASEAARAMGKASSSLIARAAAGKAKTAYGYEWIFEDQSEEVKE